MRESPAVDIVSLICEGLPDTTVLAVDPFASQLPPPLQGLDNLLLCGLSEAVERADIIVLLVDHEAFRAIKRTRLAGKVVYDTRGFWR
jgi:UDP-N-acetyl-D-mannosaminuronic acid dehydrogenase